LHGTVLLDHSGDSAKLPTTKGLQTYFETVYQTLGKKITLELRWTSQILRLSTVYKKFTHCSEALPQLVAWRSRRVSKNNHTEIRDQCALSFAIGWYKRRNGKMKREDERIRSEPQNLGCCVPPNFTLDEGQPAPVRWGTIDFLIR